MALVEAHEVEPRCIFHFIYIVENYDSTTLSTAYFQKRDPFDHPEVVNAFWLECLAAGFLQLNSDGTLQITEKGEAVRRQRWQIFNDALSKLVLLPDGELERLNDLLMRVVAETAVTTTKASAWAFHTRQQHGLGPPVAPLTPLAHFIELRMDLGAFRDDAHLTAWRVQHDVSPHAWEILGEMWQNEMAILDDLVAKLARRGFPKEETADALTALVQLGWLKQSQENYHLTQGGHTVRQKAEQQTNHTFYAPWSVLSSSELKSVAICLGALEDMC